MWNSELGESAMFYLILAACSILGDGGDRVDPFSVITMRFDFPDGKTKFYFCHEKHEIFGAVYYRCYTKSADGFVFAPSLYMSCPPMTWAVPNNALSGGPASPGDIRMLPFPAYEPRDP